MKIKEFTIEERKEYIDAHYSDFQDIILQDKFKEYRKYASDKLGEPSGAMPNSDISFGFNACLTMIKDATDIDWSKVKWKGYESSMVSWYSAATNKRR